MNKKEKLTIIAASAIVLSALTLTGIFMSQDMTNKDGSGNQENSIDFAKIERENLIDLPDVNDDGAEGVIEPDATPANTGSAVNDRYGDVTIVGETVENIDDQNATLGTDKAAVFMEEKVLGFSDSDSLVLPIIGDVIIDYSMDAAVYHDTMQQYRYSSALVIAANEGDVVTAAVDAKVTNIYSDAQTGKTVSLDIGGGYELTYGQLENVKVNIGDYCSAGDIIGYIAAPTIYYTQEGPNIYYKLTKNGEPIDPLFRDRED